MIDEVEKPLEYPKAAAGEDRARVLVGYWLATLPPLEAIEVMVTWADSEDLLDELLRRTTKRLTTAREMER